MNPPRAANEIHFRLAAAGRPLADNGRALGAWGARVARAAHIDQVAPWAA